MSISAFVSAQARVAIFSGICLVAGVSALAASAAAPAITTPPANQTVNVGQTATFTVAASGGTLTYQWKKNNVNVVGGSGATTTSYTTPATVAGDHGAQFTCAVTDATGTTTSAAGTLTVNVQPAITSQTPNRSIVVGQTTTFGVVATGNSLSYQWKKNDVNVVGGSGGTTATYTTPVAVIGDNGAVYNVVVTNTVGNVTSDDRTLTVGAATAAGIGTPPASQTIAVGQTATFTVVATGSTPITYQWTKDGVNVGGNTASYTTPVAVIGDNGAIFRVTVSNITGGSVTSGPVTLTVNPATAPSITTPPANQTVFVGQTATFTVVAGGSSPFTYQWQKNGVNVVGGTGGTTATYTTPATVIGDNTAKYRVVVNNVLNTPATSAEATLTVNPIPAPVIGTQPLSQSVVAGQTATFTVAATGMGTLTYQWKKGGVNVVGGSGATTATYTTPTTVIGDNGALYSVVVTGSGGPTTSNNATLTVTPLLAPTITVQPVDRTVVVGFPATFSVTATSTATISYAWSKNGVPIPGATAATYTTPATVLGDDGASFTVLVSNTAGGTTSSPAILTVDETGSSIPDPWLDLDIGAVGMPGDAELVGSVWTVCGAGANIGGTADAFNFLYQPLSMDGSVIARVTPGTSTAQAKVGVMIRETLTANSRMAGIFVTGAHGTVFLQRTTTGGAAGQTVGVPATIVPPYWVKLSRTGDTFTASTSPDGANWTVVGTSVIVMPTSFIGFAVTSADIGALHCATLDSHSGTGGWRPLLRSPKKDSGGGGGGCGLVGLEGVLLAGLWRAAARSRRGRPTRRACR